MKFNVNFSALFLALLTSFSSAPTWSQTPAASFGGAEVAVFTPWSFFQKSLQKTLSSNGSVHKNLGDLDLEFANLTWHLKNVQAAIEADFEQGSLTSNAYDLKTRQLRLGLSVERISLNQIVEQMVDGVLVQVQVQADCTPLALTQTSAGMAARIGFQFGSADLATHFEKFELAWPERSWLVSSFTCHGPAGFSENLQTQLSAQLASAESLRPLIQDFLAKSLQELVGEVLAKLKTPVALPIEQSSTPLTLAFKEFQSVNGGILNRGTLVWSGNPGETSVRSFEAKDLPADISGDSPILLTAAESWTDLLRAQLDARPVWTQIDLKKQSFFTRILSSRFLQFFLWPDLWNYSKSSPFTLSVAKPQGLKLKWNANGSADISLSNTAWVQSSRKSRSWNYIRLDAKAAGSLTPSIKNGKISLHAKIKTSGLSAKFGDDYKKAFHPNSWLATSLLQDFFNNMGQSLDASVELPALDLGPLGSARADGWKSVAPGTIGIPFLIHAAP